MENTTKDRLIQFIQFNHMSTKSFQERIGVSGSYVQNMVNGIGGGVVKRIMAEFPELNIDWLLAGEGDMINPIVEKKEEVRVVGKLVPVLPIRSIGCLLDDFTNNYELTNCEMFISPIDDADLALTISGDSMMPELANGSKAIVKRVDENCFLDWGRTFVLDTKNGVVVKRLFPSSAEGYYSCHSNNERYPAFEIKKSDVRSIYQVLACITLH